MTKFYIHLDETFIGTVTADSVRGRETWTFQYDEGYVNASVPFLDPAIANVKGPQFPRSKAGFGFLSDVAPDRWGRKLIRRRRPRDSHGRGRPSSRNALIGTVRSGFTMRPR